MYFQGKKFNINLDGDIERVYDSKVVDLHDVTGTGFKSSVDYGWLVMAIISAIFFMCGITLIFAIYCFQQYFKSKYSFIFVQYAGGEICYDVKWFGSEEIDVFQKQLQWAKDRALKKGVDSQQNKTLNESQNSKADELLKMGDLLRKRLISQEEFDKMKKDII